MEMLISQKNYPGRPLSNHKKIFCLFISLEDIGKYVGLRTYTREFFFSGNEKSVSWEGGHILGEYIW